MVAANEVDSVWISQLETDKERNSLDRKETAVYVVACRKSALQTKVACDEADANVPKNR